MQCKFAILLALIVAFCTCFLGCHAAESPRPLAKASSPTPSPRSSPAVRSQPDDNGTDEDSDSQPEDEDVRENADDEDSEAGYFHGHRCTIDCSGHEAGYEWAEGHDIHDPDDCGGNSESFIEGCRTYAEENPLEDEP